MITAQLRRVPEGGSDYETVATVQVDADGTYQIDDPEGYVPTALHVLVVDESGQLQRVDLEHDPQTWVRNLPSLMRTGYLVPVITEDTSMSAPPKISSEAPSATSSEPGRAH